MKNNILNITNVNRNVMSSTTVLFVDVKKMAKADSADKKVEAMDKEEQSPPI